MNEGLEAFLAELTELSRKHGIVIGGCGCCGSPWVYKKDVLDTERYISENGELLDLVAPI